MDVLESAADNPKQEERGSITEPDAGELAHLTVRVSKRQRLHWLIEAKKQGTSLTAAIVDALSARFGNPE